MEKKFDQANQKEGAEQQNEVTEIRADLQSEEEKEPTVSKQSREAKKTRGRRAKRSPSRAASKMQVLYAVFEADPFIKTGGLGDVGGSLPPAICKAGADMRVVLPKLGSIPTEYKEKMRKIAEFTVPLSWRNQYCGIERLKHKGVTYYFLDNEYYFKRPAPYGYMDDGERIAFFSKAVLECLQHIPDFSPDIIHCNDWHTALVPVFLREHYMGLPDYRKIRTVFSIHNLKFQGIFPDNMLGNVLGLSYNKPAVDQLSYGWDAINFMQGALFYSDRLSTVSPSYAEEICTPWFGENMDRIFRQRRSILSGILNGIDAYANSPGRDVNLEQKYNATTFKKGKAANKAALQRQLGLAENPDIPLLVIISRLTEQKGLDLVLRVLEEMLRENLQLAVLGVGEAKYEDAFLHFQGIMPDKMAAYINFDRPMSSRFYAGADMLLMPSKFEPCGLSQMAAMRYGTLPIVRETGGLKDSVIPYNEFEETGDGFSFANYNAHEMLFTIRYAIDIYCNHRGSWDNMIRRAMRKDFSWKQSAQKYIELYEGLLCQ